MAVECRIGGIYPKLFKPGNFTSQSQWMVGLICEMLQAAYRFTAMPS